MRGALGEEKDREKNLVESLVETMNPLIIYFNSLKPNAGRPKRTASGVLLIAASTTSARLTLGYGPCIQTKIVPTRP